MEVYLRTVNCLDLKQASDAHPSESSLWMGTDCLRYISNKINMKGCKYPGRRWGMRERNAVENVECCIIILHKRVRFLLHTGLFVKCLRMFRLCVLRPRSVSDPPHRDVYQLAIWLSKIFSSMRIFWISFRSYSDVKISNIVNYYR